MQSTFGVGFVRQKVYVAFIENTIKQFLFSEGILVKKIGVLGLILLVILLPSCKSKKSLPSEMIGGFLAGQALPAGTVYTTEAQEESHSFVSPTLLLSLFGHCKEEMTLVESGAIYLSARDEICEVYVFLCYAASGSEKISELCLARVDMLKKHRPELESCVAVNGRYVLFTVGEQAEHLMRDLRHVVRK